MDIRIERTYQMLCTALEELLEEKTFDEITVVELCERSTVRRATFYRHFEEKFAFFEYYLASLTARFMAELELTAGADDLLSYARKMHKALIGFLDEHPRLAKNNLRRAARASDLDLLVRQIADGIITFAQRDCERTGRTLPVPPSFLGLFYSGGLMQTLRWWILEDKPISSKKLVDYSMVYLENLFSAPPAAPPATLPTP